MLREARAQGGLGHDQAAAQGGQGRALGQGLRLHVEVAAQHPRRRGGSQPLGDAVRYAAVGRRPVL
eukprot:11194986-Lingulodinium_polyedra.AAC.1